MQHDHFIWRVQARARLTSRCAAETATRASLETLAERIPSALAENVAAQLPREIGEHLRRVASAPHLPEDGIRLSREAYFVRLAQRSHADVGKAVHEARCVMEIVREATQDSLTHKIRESLDDDLADALFA